MRENTTSPRLYRLSSPDVQPKRVVLIGNGALKNGWEPMRQAALRSAMFGSKLQNMSEAYINKLLPLLPTIAVQEYNLQRRCLVERRDFSQVEKAISQMKEFFDFVNCVGEEYSDSKLEFQDQFQLIHSISSTYPTGIVCLNYDASAWNITDSKGVIFPNLLHIHGRACEPESMYFPTDSTVSDELMTSHSLINPKWTRKIVGKMISNSISRRMQGDLDILSRRQHWQSGELRQMHFRAIEWLERAEEIYIWGVGFNMYDTELLSIVHRAVDKRQSPDPQLIVINPDGGAVVTATALLGINPKMVSWVPC